MKKENKHEGKQMKQEMIWYHIRFYVEVRDKEELEKREVRIYTIEPLSTEHIQSIAVQSIQNESEVRTIASEVFILSGEPGTYSYPDNSHYQLKKDEVGYSKISVKW